jgi:uncharacterized membrane protein YccC
VSPAKTASATVLARRQAPSFPVWLDRLGFEPALFSVKCFVAAMLAYWIALRIGLTRPYWAVTTAYIVAQPLAGAVLSKAAFRVAGTMLGATAAVVLVPNFVNEPAALSVMLALWLGLCLYLSLLDRTPRAYVFLLAGYTASIIGFPSVQAPGAIFDTAIARVEEIMLGILCGSLIHGVLLPRTVADQLLDRIDRMIDDSERWSAESLAGTGGDALARDRRRLAVDIAELHMLSIHLPFDTARFVPRVRSVRALQDAVSLLLPLASAIEDRRQELERLHGHLDGDLASVLDRTVAWLGTPRPTAEWREAGALLIAHAAALEPPVRAAHGWSDALRLSLLARLAELVATHIDARELREQIRAPTARALSRRVRALLDQAGNRALHRDRGIAIRSALGTIATVLLGCSIWIGTGWPDGAGAVLIAGVCCALFGSSDEPAPAVFSFLWGSVIGIAIAAIYAYAILPQVTAFPVLVAVLAPTLLLLGALLARPGTQFVTLGALLGVLNSTGLADRYTPGFPSFVNGSIAQIIGTFFAAVMVGMFLTLGTTRAAERLIQAGWRDLARRSNLPGPPDLIGWTSRMLDRIGLLAPRLAARGEDPGKPLLDALIDLRTGLSVGALRGLRLQGGSALITPVLESVGRYYASLDIRAPAPPPPALLDCVDRALVEIAADPNQARGRTGVLALVSLRRNLFPAAPPLAARAA